MSQTVTVWFIDNDEVKDYEGIEKVEEESYGDDVTSYRLYDIVGLRAIFSSGGIKRIELRQPKDESPLFAVCW
jgi:hypothetical protein